MNVKKRKVSHSKIKKEKKGDAPLARKKQEM